MEIRQKILVAAWALSTGFNGGIGLCAVMEGYESSAITSGVLFVACGLVVVKMVAANENK